MRIRAITLLAEPTLEQDSARRFFASAREAFQDEVQTLRLATTPFPTWWKRSSYPAIQAQEVAEHWTQAGAEAIGLGPVLLRHDAGWLDVLPDIIASGHSIYAAVEIADGNGNIDVGRCRATARIIRRLSGLGGNGAANFYLAALANCSGGTPFLPTAYHEGGPPRFAIATESADLVLESFAGAPTLMAARETFIGALESKARDLSVAAANLAAETGVTFGGIDFSPAPALPPDSGLAEGLEELGIGPVGTSGAVFAAAFTADALGSAEFQRCGFSGLVFPVLEDDLLARRAAAGLVTISDLLVYAAVCGAGLDTVPLPGDINHDTLTAILLDVAALAVRLDKPLTARLMPVPGLAAGEPVQTLLPQMLEGRVMAVKENEAGDALSQITRLQMHAYHDRRER